MPISVSLPTIHHVEQMTASVLEFSGGYALRLQMADNSEFTESLGIWFTGPLAKERVTAYAAAINAVHGLPLMIDEPMGVSR